MGIDAEENNMLLILHIISITGHRLGNYLDSMLLFQNVGCEHEV